MSTMPIMVEKKSTITVHVQTGKISDRLLKTTEGKAAILEADSMAQKKLTASISSLDQKMVGVKSELSVIRSLLGDEKNHKIIERAMALTSLDSFEFYENGNWGNSSDMRYLLKVTIFGDNIFYLHTDNGR